MSSNRRLATRTPQTPISTTHEPKRVNRDQRDRGRPYRRAQTTGPDETREQESKRARQQTREHRATEQQTTEKGKGERREESKKKSERDQQQNCRIYL
jgi:hypothetical protein